MADFRYVTKDDFDMVFDFIEKLWDYNTYKKEDVRPIYEDILENKDNFMFFVTEGDKVMGFCHGIMFNTFWMSGLTCYISGIITKPQVRGRGYGVKLMDHAGEIAKTAGCKCLILDSALHRKEAHGFYEKYGFEKGCYGFELMI